MFLILLAAAGWGCLVSPAPLQLTWLWPACTTTSGRSLLAQWGKVAVNLDCEKKAISQWMSLWMGKQGLREATQILFRASLARAELSWSLDNGSPLLLELGRSRISVQDRNSLDVYARGASVKWKMRWITRAIFRREECEFVREWTQKSWSWRQEGQNYL